MTQSWISQIRLSFVFSHYVPRIIGTCCLAVILLSHAGCRPPVDSAAEYDADSNETIAELSGSLPAPRQVSSGISDTAGGATPADPVVARAAPSETTATAVIPQSPGGTIADEPSRPTVAAVTPAAENPATVNPAGPSAAVVLGAPELTAGIPGEGPLKDAEIEAWLANADNHRPLAIELPPGLAGAAAQVQGLEANPMTRAKIELGRQLYFDTRLSSDNSISCASCHHPDEGYARKTRFGVGVRDQTGNRNSPVSYNRIVSGLQFWDGRADSLEAQAVGPIANPIEMANTHESAVATVQQIRGYKLQFDAVFPGEGVTIDNLGKALATFERAIVTAPAPYDYFEITRTLESQFDADEIAELEQDDPELYAKYQEAVKLSAAMSASARRGREIFFTEKGNCTACHAGANFTDEKYHNLGVGMDQSEPDLGRFTITQDPKDRGAFKTPTVRNITKSAPYMHDGSQATLAEVVEWYAKGGHPNPSLSEKMKQLQLSPEEKADLVAFMVEGLTSDFPPVEQGRLPVSE